MALLSVEDALAQVLDQVEVLESETVPLRIAHQRVLAEQVVALRTQPPFAASAMDGYAMRSTDLAINSPLRLIGESAAGQGFSGVLGAGECVRIFTGAPIPAEADTIVIQEHVRIDGASVIPTHDTDRFRHIRPAGLDFTQGDPLLAAGQRLSPSSLSLAAAMGHPRLRVTRKPRVAILATGDELVQPGEVCGPDQIVASNHFAVAAMVEALGGIALDLGIAKDTHEDLEKAFQSAEDQKADILVTLGGASVGDRDLVQNSLAQRGMKLGFWRIAMRPGKPLIFGSLGSMKILGLPGNPISSIICAQIFLAPLLKSLQGDATARHDPTTQGVVGCDLRENDQRQDYMRARITGTHHGLPVVVPFSSQDSSMLGLMSQAQALLIRPPFAPAAKQNDACRIILL
jgi:molybdopterin molybdotransferase